VHWSGWRSGAGACCARACCARACCAGAVVWPLRQPPWVPWSWT